MGNPYVSGHCIRRLLTGTVFLILIWLRSQAAYGQSLNEMPAKAEVLQAIGKSSLLGNPLLNVEIKAWKPLQGSFVALIYIQTGDAEVVRTAQIRPTVALLVRSNGKLVSVGTAMIDEPCRSLSKGADSLENMEDGSECQNFQLDMVPYVIRPNNTAIGIRTHVHEVFPAGEDDSDDLTLFHVANNTLKAVFQFPMTFSDEQRGPGDSFLNNSVLHISGQQTHGYFNLRVVEHCVHARLFEDGKTKYKTIIHTFRWFNKGYVEAK